MLVGVEVKVFVKVGVGEFVAVLVLVCVYVGVGVRVGVAVKVGVLVGVESIISTKSQPHAPTESTAQFTTPTMVLVGVGVGTEHGSHPVFGSGAPPDNVSSTIVPFMYIAILFDCPTAGKYV